MKFKVESLGAVMKMASQVLYRRSVSLKSLPAEATLPTELGSDAGAALSLGDVGQFCFEDSHGPYLTLLLFDLSRFLITSSVLAMF